MGERAADAGGPYRDVWSSMCSELMSSSLPLMRPVPDAFAHAGKSVS